MGSDLGKVCRHRKGAVTANCRSDGRAGACLVYRQGGGGAEALFPTCEKISIDYAVMEKAEDIFVLPAEFGWSDLGSWGSLHTLLPQDENGNASVGTNVKLFDCRNCVVHVADERKVVLEGLDGYIVAEKNGQLLICRLSEEQRIKDFSAGK